MEIPSETELQASLGEVEEKLSYTKMMLESFQKPFWHGMRDHISGMQQFLWEKFLGMNRSTMTKTLEERLQDLQTQAKTLQRVLDLPRLYESQLKSLEQDKESLELEIKALKGEQQ